MKSYNFILQIFLVLLVIQFTSCGDLTNDNASNLRILPQQIISANIDARGIHFMPQMLMAEGGNPLHTYSWSLDTVSHIPPGLSIGTNDGIVTMSDTTNIFPVGTTNFRVNVSDGEVTRAETVGLLITNNKIGPIPDAQQLAINEFQLINGKLNQSYCASLFVKGGIPPYEWSIDKGYPSNLESYGLSLDPVYGLISGKIPNSASPRILSFRVVIRDSKGKLALFNPIYKITVH